MSSKLGTLTLDLVARIGQFVEPIIKAEKVAADSAESITKKFNATTLAVQAFGAVVAGVSVAGVVEFAKVYIDSATEIDRGAKLIGSSIEQIQYYAAGAKVAGVNLEKFVDINKDVNDRLGEARRGEGEMMDFFTKIAPRVGITIDQFKKLSGPEALQLYYNGLQKANLSHAEQITYMEQIANDASLLIPVLKDGGKGFEEWGEQAQKAGAIMSEDMVKQLVHAQENIQILDLKWQGVKATVVNDVMPAFSYVSENLEEIQNIAVLLSAALFGRVAGGFAVSTAATIANTVASQRKIIADYEIAKAELAATAAMVRSIGTINAETVAMMANARAAYQKASALKEATVAGLTFSRVGAGLLGVLGGPVGLATTALAVGASFLLMRDSSEEVKPALDKQGKSVAELVSEYANLSTAQKRAFQYAETKELANLTNEYTKANQQVRAYASGIAETVLKDEASKNAVRALIHEFDSKKISAEELANKINSLNVVSVEYQSNLDKHAIASTNAKTAMQGQQQVVESLESKNILLAKTHDQITTSVNAQSTAYENLSQKQRDALNSIHADLEKDKYVATNMALGWSREKAEFYANYRDNAGLGFKGKPLSQLELQTVEQGYKLQQTTTAREESEKKIEDTQKKQADALKKQNEEAAKKYKYTVKEEEMLRRVATLASKNDFNTIGDKYGIPQNLLAAVMAQESKGDVNAKSPTGAIGPFQTTGIYRSQYGLSVNDSYDPKKSAEVAAKDLSASYKIFGNWTDAITAYNAGVSGTKNLLEKGFTGSAAKTKEAKEYASKVNKWFVALSGSDGKDSGFYGENQAEALKEYQSYLDKTEQLRIEALARQVSIVQKYASEEQRIHLTNADAIKEIEAAYTVDDSNRQKYLDLQKLVYQKDLEAFKKTQLQKQYEELSSLKSMQSQIQGLSAGSDDIFAKATMSPQDYANWSLKNDRDNAKKSLRDDLTSTEQNITTSEVYKTDDDRYQALLEAHKNYRDGLTALDVQYAQQSKELAQAQKMEQLNLWGGILSNAQNTFAQLTQSAKDGAGEQSTVYRTMFAFQQGFSVASSLVAAWTAYAQAFADPSAMTLPQKFAGGAAVMAALMPAITTISSIGIAGMAHDGIDNIPREGTWLLDGGERVLNPQQNKDLTRYLNESRSNQSSQPQTVENVVKVIMVKDEEEAKEHLYSKDGEKAFLYHFKRNKSKL